MDPYLYPGTDVLQNLAGIRDAAKLSNFEAGRTYQRIRQLQHQFTPGQFDVAHVQAIHRYIFQDVYSWAGEFRTVGISRSGPFAFCAQIVPSLQQLAADLKREHFLASLTLEQFPIRAAHYLGQLNAIHPFREGNGRTQNEFIRQLAHRNGYHLDWSGITRDQLYEAARRSFLRGDDAGFAEIMVAILRR